jgi:hypothetical protein
MIGSRRWSRVQTRAQALSSQARPIEHNLDLPVADPVLRFLSDKCFKGRAWRITAVSFGLYYIGSCLTAWESGTLYSWRILNSATAPLDPRALLHFVGTIAPPRNGNFVPLLSDFAHLNFSVLIAFGVFPLGYTFLLDIPNQFRRFFSSWEADDSDSKSASSLLRELQQSVSRPVNLAVAGIFGAFATVTFVALSRSQNAVARTWWGHNEFGDAGYYLALMQGLFCYYAMWGFRMTWILNERIEAEAVNVRVFRPFHEDGYYGLEPLARMLLWEAAILLLTGLALFSTFYLGYFGLEKSMLLLACLLLYTVLTAIVLAKPSIALTLQVRRLRSSAVAAIEPGLLRMANWQKSTDSKHGREFREELASLLKYHETLKACRTIPFGFAQLNTVILGYAVQSFILLHEFYARFR